MPKDRKSLFRQFLAGMYDAVVITDPNGHIIEINSRAEDHFGYIAEEVVDKPISFFIPGLAPQIVKRLRKGLDDGHHMIIDANGLNKDGSKFFCEVAVSMIDLMEPDDLVFTIRNVERRRLIREMLRSKESAFSLSHAALFTCDADGHFTNVNKAFLSMFGLENEESAMEKVFSDFFGDDPLPANFAKALIGEQTVAGLVSEPVDGEDAEEIEVVLAPDRDGSKIKGVVGSVIEL
ncbi:MAG: PAS domain S-box protein [Kiritimatiellae bacterium]|nr:PAS domain S-box protein [Kiritimatiellia bacterium]